MTKTSDFWRCAQMMGEMAVIDGSLIIVAGIVVFGVHHRITKRLARDANIAQSGLDK